jgi:muramoyltetrapeptide carboxypeptidase LdcA involved in peptidoglycan recycling
MTFERLSKLKKGDKVAMLSPSFAGPGVWPHMYELGKERLRSVFGLEAVEYPTNCKVGATAKERMQDLVSALKIQKLKL